MNFLLTLAYDGTNYCGFQVQPNGRSVAATFQDALEAVLGSRPDIKGCSRTDAGVHALGFRLNFHADTRIPPQKLPLALNQHLPPDIRVLAAQTVPEDFHARYAAHTKTYLYRIHNHPIDSPFDAAYYTRVPRRLDESAMQAAAQQFVGTHDFLALCAAAVSLLPPTGTPCAPSRTATLPGAGTRWTLKRPPTATCTIWCAFWRVLCARWARGGCAADIPAILASRDRSRAGHSARKGLVLKVCGLPGKGRAAMKKLHRGGSNPDGEPLSAGRVEYPGGSAPAGAPPPFAPYCHHSGGADNGHPVCHRRGGGIHRPGKGSGGYGAHRPVPGGGLAAADRPWRADGRAAHVRQLCGHGRGCLCGVQLRRHRLASIQSGYARPALAAGKTRFVLYNRSGNELRVESRTQNLYSKTLENSIYLCAMSDTGTLAVATDSADSTARLTVYTSTMTEQLHWDMTSAQGTPVRMAFAADSRRLAVAAVTSSAGQLQANLFVLSLAQGDPVQLSSGDSVPQWLGWLNNDTVLAVYENCAVVYGADGGERGRFDLGGGSLVSVSQDGANAALLLENGQVCTAVLLDKDLNVQYSGNVPAGKPDPARTRCCGCWSVCWSPCWGW